jgi:hypothetical protein
MDAIICVGRRRHDKAWCRWIDSRTEAGTISAHLDVHSAALLAGLIRGRIALKLLITAKALVELVERALLADC